MLTALSTQEREAIAFYDQRVRSGDTADRELWADTFTYHMFDGHPEGPVVDIGCGIGRTIPVLNDYGIRAYFGVDPSAESVAFCRQRFPHLDFEISEVRQLGETYQQHFGGFLLLNVLMHTPEAELAAVLRSIHTSLLPGSPGLMNANKPAAAQYVNDAAKMLTLSYYEPSDFSKALEANGFEIWNFHENDVSFMVHVIAV